MDYNAFYYGDEFEAYRFLGAHVEENGVRFRTYATAAEKVAVIGEFSGWQECPMERIHDGRFWEAFIENARKGQMYKFRIHEAGGTVKDHCDPYGFYAQLRPDTASIIYGLSDYDFEDRQWVADRDTLMEKPLNIYEVHAGSWKQKTEAGEEVTKRWYHYRDLAEYLIPYMKENYYNCLELMPLEEYPCDESWGYQGTGFFSVTSRYGTPDDLKYLVKACHKNGICVLVDFVPVHFAVDDYALASYDGSCLYEYPDAPAGRSEWGSCNFMHSKGEVRSFLKSAACYWLSQLHFDGLRMDAISNLIYWQGDRNRGENIEAIRFLKGLNEGLKRRVPSVILIAEDSTDYPNVTKPVWAGGLGFDYKWDMGWMNDTLSYFQSPPYLRKERYHKLTFSMMYFYNEKYLLPFSHDESVHGKATILQKMNGQYEDKFPQARALYLYMMTHPGKKLNFMGNEIGQLREWDERREQDWDILRYPLHDSFHRYIRKLNEIYMERPSLWEGDYDPSGFQWIDCHQEERVIYAYERRSIKGKVPERIAAVFNFSDQCQENYLLNVGEAKKVSVLLDSDAVCYGGQGICEKQKFTITGKALPITLAPFSGILLLLETE